MVSESKPAVHVTLCHWCGTYWKTRDPYPLNPYPRVQVRVSWGTGTGSPGKPQGYPWQSLSAAGVSLLGALFRIWQLRQRLSFLESSYDPRCIKASFIMWQDRREFVFYLRLFGNFVAYQVAGCAIKSSAFTVSLPFPMIYHEIFIYSARCFHLLRVSALPQCFTPLTWELCYVVRRIHDQLVVFHLVLLLFHIFFCHFFLFFFHPLGYVFFP